jgi:hypothetical protein
MKAEFQLGDLVALSDRSPFKHVRSRLGIIYSFDLAKKKARVQWTTGNKTIIYLRGLKRVASYES